MRPGTKSALIQAGKAITRTIRDAYQRGGPRKRVKLTRRKPRELQRRRQRAAAKMERVKMDIKKVKCFIDQRTAEHIVRCRRAGSVLCGVNLVNHVLLNKLGTVTSIEDTAASLRFFDPVTNALVTKDLASGTYSREACVGIYKKVLIKNNYQVPCHIELWSGTPVDATNLSPHDAFTGGLVDQGGVSATSPLIRLTDSRSVADVWDMSLISKRVLQPGEVVIGKHLVKKFDYTFSTNDQQTLAYQKNQGGHVFYLRVYGTLGHDTSAAQYGRMEAGVDWEWTATVTWEYDAGKDLKDYSVDDGSATLFTNSGVQSLKPLADNLPYSIN